MSGILTPERQEEIQFLLQTLPLEGEARVDFVRRQVAEYAALDAAAQAESERAAEREHELRLAQIQADTERAASAASQRSSQGDSAADRRPPLQPYKEDVPLDEFLTTFDAYCDTFDVETSEAKVRMLYGLLPQRLLTVLGHLELTDRKDYEVVTTALLQAANYTADELRTRYLEAYPTPEESFGLYLRRKHRRLREWLRLAKVPAEKLEEFLVTDAFLPMCPPELAAHLRVELKGEVDLGKAALAADQYLQHSRPGQRPSDTLRRPQEIKGRMMRPPKPANATGAIPKRPSQEAANVRTNGQQDTPPGRNSPPSRQKFHRRQPYNQNGTPPNGHPRQRSPQPHPPRNGRPGTPSTGLQSMSVEPVETEDPSYALGRVAVSVGNSAPRCMGRVNGTETKVILDTGAEGIFVSRALVAPGDFTGQNALVRFPEGPPQPRPWCTVMLDCPVYRGKAPAIALDNPSAEILIGRVRSLRPHFKQDAFNRVIAEWDKPSEKGKGIANSHPTSAPAPSEPAQVMLDGNEAPLPEQPTAPPPLQQDTMEPQENVAPLDLLQDRDDTGGSQQPCPTPSLQSENSRAERRDSAPACGQDAPAGMTHPPSPSGDTAAGGTVVEDISPLALALEDAVVGDPAIQDLAAEGATPEDAAVDRGIAAKEAATNDVAEGTAADAAARRKPPSADDSDIDFTPCGKDDRHTHGLDTPGLPLSVVPDAPKALCPAPAERKSQEPAQEGRDLFSVPGSTAAHRLCLKESERVRPANSVPRHRHWQRKNDGQKWAFPARPLSLAVREKDGTRRFRPVSRCRSLRTVFDGDPTNDPSCRFAKCVKAQLLLKKDLARRFWQGPPREEGRQLLTRHGPYESRVMPFGPSALSFRHHRRSIFPCDRHAIPLLQNAVRTNPRSRRWALYMSRFLPGLKVPLGRRTFGRRP